jgi:uncharacterized Zn finger protein
MGSLACLRAQISAFPGVGAYDELLDGSSVKLFSERDLKRLAGRRRFARGQALVDALDGLDEDEFSLWSYVEDGEEYLAIVHRRAGPLPAECGCTDGRSGSFCEHAVAVGLCYLSDDDSD